MVLEVVVGGQATPRSPARAHLLHEVEDQPAIQTGHQLGELVLVGNRSRPDADVAALDGVLIDLWAHSPTVTTLQPSGGRQVGWDKVRESWEQFAQLVSEGRIKLRDQLIQVAGEVAYELGTQQFAVTMAGHSVLGEHRVTNIYRREVGGWKVVHHHTDLSPAMLNVLSRLQAGMEESVA